MPPDLALIILIMTRPYKVGPASKIQMLRATLATTTYSSWLKENKQFKLLEEANAPTYKQKSIWDIT